MKKALLFFTALIYLQSQPYAQLQGQQLIDSLLHGLPKAKNDTNAVKLLTDLSHTYYSINADKGLQFGKQALALAEKLNWKNGIGNACRTIAGNYGYGKSDYATALTYSLLALQQFKEIDDKLGSAKILSDIGVLYWFQSNFPEALKYYLDALRINEETGNKADMAVTLCNIGIIYNNQKEYQKALDYIFRANKIDTQTGNKSGVATNLLNIGGLYRDLNNLDKALAYNTESLKLFTELGDNKGKARTLANIGVIYSEQKNYSKALESFNRALLINEKTDIKIETAISLNGIGFINLQTAKTSIAGKQNSLLLKAKKFTDSAAEINTQTGDVEALSGNYKQLSEIQMLLGDNRAALESYKKYTVLKDSVFNIEKDKKLTETAMQYAFDKKEAALKQEQEKKDIQQRNIRNLFIAGLGLLLLLFTALINRYRYKQKANKKLTIAYAHLKNTQEQLVQSERMAAFGIMASRMAHEIQNPLNFVNNFSDLSKDLVQDIFSIEDETEKKELTQELISNLDKINHYGNRASGIISELQEHTRSGTAQQFFEEATNEANT